MSNLNVLPDSAVVKALPVNRPSFMPVGVSTRREVSGDEREVSPPTDINSKKKAAAKAKKEQKAETEDKPKGPSIAKQWADLMMGQGKWFAFANHTSGSEVVYQWNGSYLEHVGGGDGVALAADWLDENIPEAAKTPVAIGCWNWLCGRLRVKCPMPKQTTHTIIPCSDVYLMMDSKGRLTAIEPDAAYGMTYALSIKSGTAPGNEHILKPLPANSKFRQWIEKALPNPEVRALVQEQCGLTLIPNNFQIATWWTGKAGSGKSTLTEICKLMQRHSPAIRLKELGDRFGLEKLIGASLITVDEVEMGEKWDEGMFKSLVSGNGVSIDRKNEKALIDYHLNAKWIITSNGTPFVRDKSDGVWRRLCIVSWEYVVPEKERKTNYHEQLVEEEGKYILDWMLEGAQRLVQRGRFLAEHERPAQVQLIKEECRNDSDSVRAWTRDCQVFTVVSPKHKSRPEVYQHYVEWCELSDHAVLDSRVFWRGLRGILKVEDSSKVLGGTTFRTVNIDWLGLRHEEPAIDIFQNGALNHGSTDE